MSVRKVLSMLAMRPAFATRPSSSAGGPGGQLCFLQVSLVGLTRDESLGQRHGGVRVSLEGESASGLAAAAALRTRASPRAESRPATGRA